MRGFGFVEMSTDAQEAAAIEALDGAFGDGSGVESESGKAQGRQGFV